MWKVCQEPLLYLSLYLKEHRPEYYELLDVVRRVGDWERWLTFFADAVAHTATGAVETARRLAELFRRDREKLAELGRSANSAIRVHYALQARPICTIASMINESEALRPNRDKGAGKPGA